jgi:hypothetical protein
VLATTRWSFGSGCEIAFEPGLVDLREAVEAREGIHPRFAA